MRAFEASQLLMVRYDFLLLPFLYCYNIFQSEAKIFFGTAL